MLEGINGVDAALVVETEELLEQIDALAAKMSAEALFDVAAFVRPVLLAFNARET